MKINTYLDSTYLKTPKESGLSFIKNLKCVYDCVVNAHKFQIFAVMIRPEHIEFVKKLLTYLNSKVKIGTVISFPEGTHCITEKINEAELAIQNGVDELDFVINYNEFKKGNIQLIEEEFIKCSKICISNNKVVKWIIEIAALTNEEISSISKKLAEIAEKNFTKEELNLIFLKSSTGYFEANPNGATIEGIKLMIKNGNPLKIKASGGIKTKQDAEKFINLGVQRIGTSNALVILGINDKIENY